MENWKKYLFKTIGWIFMLAMIILGIFILDFQKVIEYSDDGKIPSIREYITLDGQFLFSFALTVTLILIIVILFNVFEAIFHQKQSWEKVLHQLEKSSFICVWILGIWAINHLLNVDNDEGFKLLALISFPLYFLAFLSIDITLYDDFEIDFPFPKIPISHYFITSGIFALSEITFFVSDFMDLLDQPIRFISRINVIILVCFLFTPNKWREYENNLALASESGNFKSFFSLPSKMHPKYDIFWIIFVGFWHICNLVMLIESSVLNLASIYGILTLVLLGYLLYPKFQKLKENGNIHENLAIISQNFAKKLTLKQKLELFTLIFIIISAIGGYALMIAVDLFDMADHWGILFGLLLVTLAIIGCAVYYIIKIYQSTQNFDVNDKRFVENHVICSECQEPISIQTLTIFKEQNMIYCENCGAKIRREEIFSPSDKNLLADHQLMMEKLHKLTIKEVQEPQNPKKNVD